MLATAITLDNFERFVDGKDPNETYIYTNSVTCANAQFHRAHDVPYACAHVSEAAIAAIRSGMLFDTSTEVVATVCQMLTEPQLIEMLSYIACNNNPHSIATFGELARLVKIAQTIKKPQVSRVEVRELALAE